MRERFDKHNENRRSVQEELELVHDNLWKQVDEATEEMGRELEEEFIITIKLKL